MVHFLSCRQLRVLPVEKGTKFEADESVDDIKTPDFGELRMFETKSFKTAVAQEEHKHVLMLQELKVFEDDNIKDTLEQLPALPANV